LYQCLITKETAKKYIDVFCDDVTLTGDFAPIYQLIEDSGIAPALWQKLLKMLNLIWLSEEMKQLN
jgi:hypothetical protein